MTSRDRLNLSQNFRNIQTFRRQPLRPPRVRRIIPQQPPIFLHRRPAPRRIDGDDIHIRRFKAINHPPRKIHRLPLLTGMRTKRPATSLPRRHHHLTPLRHQHPRRRPIHIPKKHPLHTPQKQPHAQLPVTPRLGATGSRTRVPVPPVRAHPPPKLHPRRQPLHHPHPRPVKILSAPLPRNSTSPTHSSDKSIVEPPPPAAAGCWKHRKTPLQNFSHADRGYRRSICARVASIKLSYCTRRTRCQTRHAP